EGDLGATASDRPQAVLLLSSQNRQNRRNPDEPAILSILRPQTGTYMALARGLCRSTAANPIGFLGRWSRDRPRSYPFTGRWLHSFSSGQAAAAFKPNLSPFGQR